MVIVFWSNPVRRGKRDTEISTPLTSWKNCKDVKEIEVTVAGKKQGEEKELLMPAHQGGLWHKCRDCGDQRARGKSLVDSSVKSNKEKWQKPMSQGQVGLGQVTGVISCFIGGADKDLKPFRCDLITREQRGTLRLTLNGEFIKWLMLLLGKHFIIILSIPGEEWCCLKGMPACLAHL